jgi:hypothetical protein
VLALVIDDDGVDGGQTVPTRNVGVSIGCCASGT